MIAPAESTSTNTRRITTAFSGKGIKAMESTNPKDKIGATKPPLHLIPQSALVHTAMAMKNGADKYGLYNWRTNKVSAMTYLGAAQRHIAALIDGEDIAQDSGVHHAAHAMASLAIYLDAMEVGAQLDDRPPAGPTARLIEENTVKTTAQQTSDRFLDDYTIAEQALEGVEPVWSRQDQHLTEGDPFTIDNVRMLKAAMRTTHFNRSRVYIAGPMRGIKKFNFPAFDAARDKAISLGFDPISPADLDRQSGWHEDSPPEKANDADMTRRFVERDIDALLSLRAENGDAIALLPGWEKSRGALAELMVARWLGLRILDAETFSPKTNSHIHIWDDGNDLLPHSFNILDNVRKP